MSLQSVVRAKLGFWVVAAAMLLWPTHGSAMSSETPGSASAEIGQVLASLPPSTGRGSPNEPFDEIAVSTAASDVSVKWRIVKDQIAAEAAVLDRCMARPDRPDGCPAAARAFLNIVAEGRARDGLARIGVINRAVNLAVIPTSDMDQWGVADHWSPPLETLTTGRGDCEDYAIAKYVALIDAGVSNEDVKLVIVHNHFPDEDHAIVVTRVSNTWLILDNRSLALVPVIDFRSAVPLFILDDTGSKRFVPAEAHFGVGKSLL